MQNILRRFQICFDSVSTKHRTTIEVVLFCRTGVQISRQYCLSDAFMLDDVWSRAAAVEKEGEELFGGRLRIAMRMEWTRAC
jgi:hypothetical protein